MLPLVQKLTFSPCGKDIQAKQVYSVSIKRQCVNQTQKTSTSAIIEKNQTRQVVLQTNSNKAVTRFQLLNSVEYTI